MAVAHLPGRLDGPSASPSQAATGPTTQAAQSFEAGIKIEIFLNGGPVEAMLQPARCSQVDRIHEVYVAQGYMDPPLAVFISLDDRNCILLEVKIEPKPEASPLRRALPSPGF